MQTQIQGIENPQFWMEKALSLAETALSLGEVPVGCLFIHKGEIIATGGNAANASKNATKHAELTCIDQMVSAGQSHLFKEIDVVVTVEPCIMCASALHQLEVNSVLFGCRNSRFGGYGSVLDVTTVHKDSKTVVQGDVCGERAITLLKTFYDGVNPNAPLSKVKKKK